jgi:hypothetical protein
VILVLALVLGIAGGDDRAVWVALLGFAGVVGAAMIGNHKLNAIHVLVNSRLTKALDEISNLRREVRRLGGDVAPIEDSELEAE